MSDALRDRLTINHKGAHKRIKFFTCKICSFFVYLLFRYLESDSDIAIPHSTAQELKHFVAIVIRLQTTKMCKNISLNNTT